MNAHSAVQQKKTKLQLIVVIHVAENIYTETFNKQEGWKATLGCWVLDENC